MGPGHFAIAFAAKPAATKLPLWLLLPASELLDLMCFAFLPLGIESAGTAQGDFTSGIHILSPSALYWSHGLFMSIVWSTLAAGAVYLVSKDRRASLVMALVIFSHWALDFIVHPADLPLFFSGSPKVGLGLWSTGPGMVISAGLEIVLLIAGIIIYLRSKGVFTSKKTTPLVQAK